MFNEMNYPEKYIIRFWDKVNVPKDWAEKDQCWKWNGLLFIKTNYGSFSFNGKNLKAHRFSYEIHYGPIPEGLDFMHKCDNRKCVNPNHLKVGSRKENMEDCVEKGRSKFGSKNNMSKLTENNIIDIINKSLNGTYTNRNQVINDYKISLSELSNILCGKRWTHITSNFTQQEIEKVKYLLGCRLSIEDIADIKMRLDKGESQSSIARSYNISQPVISNMIKFIKLKMMR